MNYSDLWHMNTAGWHSESSANGIAFAPCDIDAALTIGTFHMEDQISHQEIVQLARASAPSGIDLASVSCGEFSGVRIEYVDPSEEGALYWRVWWLYLGHLHLYITYNCDPEHSNVHRGIVDWMLGTLTNTIKGRPHPNGTSN